MGVPRSPRVWFLALSAVVAAPAWGATPTVLIALPHLDAAQARPVVAALRARGSVVLDVTPSYRALHGLTFPIDGPPPEGWPPSLDGVWQEGHAACQAQAVRPPYTLANQGMFLCSRELAPWLWQQLIDHLRADEVIVVAPRRRSPAEGGDELVGIGYAPGDTTRRRLVRAHDEGALLEVVVALLAGEGAPDRRAVAREPMPHPRADSPELFQGAPLLDLDRVPVPAGCGPLPDVDIVPTAAPLAQTVGALYASSGALRAAGPRRQCALRVWTSTDNGGGVLAGSSMRSVGASLDCGPDVPPVFGRGIGVSVVHSHPRLAPHLAGALLNALCRAEATAAP